VWGLQAGSAWRAGVSGWMHFVGGKERTVEEDEGKKDISLCPIEKITFSLQK